MKFLIILINIIIFYIGANAAAGSSVYVSHPDHPGKCYVEGEDLIMSIGETKQQPGFCGITKCGKDSLLERYVCDNVTVPKGCKLKKPSNPNAVYPECCATEYVCEEDLKNVKKT